MQKGIRLFISYTVKYLNIMHLIFADLDFKIPVFLL